MKASSGPGTGNCPEAARMARRTGRSYTGPVLRISPGARLTVIRLTGQTKDRFFSALRTRSVASRTALSGRPTMVN